MNVLSSGLNWSSKHPTSASPERLLLTWEVQPAPFISSFYISTCVQLPYKKKHKPCQISVNTTRFCKRLSNSWQARGHGKQERAFKDKSHADINVTPQTQTSHCKRKHVNSVGMCSIFFREIIITCRIERCINRLGISALINTGCLEKKNNKQSKQSKNHDSF